jgi:hypothetical protein
MSNKNEIRSGALAPSPGDIDKYLYRKPQKTKMSRQEVLERVSGYFNGIIERTTNENGEVVTKWRMPPTKSGLCAALDISRQTLIRYTYESDKYQGTSHQTIAKDDWDILQKAMLIIENYYESMLSSSTPTGAIFALLNMQRRIYTNKDEIEISNGNRLEMDLPTKEEVIRRLPTYDDSIDGDIDI